MKVIASMASLPNRTLSMNQAIASLADQVDELHVTLNGHENPQLLGGALEHPAVRVRRLSYNAGARAKLEPSRTREPAIRLLVDDDIIYPFDYVETMREALERHPRCVVGVHGAVVREPVKSYRESLKIVAHFKLGLPGDRYVHILGTGTVAFRSNHFWLDSDDLLFCPNAVDVALACRARDLGLGLVAVRRRTNWLKPIPIPRGESIWDQDDPKGTGCSELKLRHNGPWPPGGFRPS